MTPAARCPLAHRHHTQYQQRTPHTPTSPFIFLSEGVVPEELLTWMMHHLVRTAKTMQKRKPQLDALL
nr:unnamed protein product [Spirometra erinaceieuropaei]